MKSLLLTFILVLLIVIVLFGGAIIISDPTFNKQLRDLATLVLMIMSLIIFIGVPITLFQLFWQVHSIEVIKKSWLTATVNNGHLLFLYGKSKIARLSLSTDKFVNEEGEISLPFKKYFLVI